MFKTAGMRGAAYAEIFANVRGKGEEGGGRRVAGARGSRAREGRRRTACSRPRACGAWRMRRPLPM